MQRTKKSLANQLDALVGRTIWYGGNYHKLKGYEINEERGRVYIHFEDRGSMDRPIETAHGLVDSFKLEKPTVERIAAASLGERSSAPVETKQEDRAEMGVAVSAPRVMARNLEVPFMGNSDLLDKASAIVLETIEGMKDGSMSIEKADSIHNGIGRILDIEKTKIAKGALAVRFLEVGG